MAQRERPFRVIVVGAGIAGLFASRCLQELGIDHVVLEKHSEVAAPSFVKTGVAVDNIIQSADGVTVHLRNGDVETGDMIIGCDGVYSDVRKFMWDHAAKTSPGLVTAKEKTCMKTTWKALILTTPPIPELGERDVTVTYNDGMMFFVASQPNIVAANVIFSLEKPFTWPKQEYYTDKDIAELAELVADKPVSNGLLFSDIWKRRHRATVVSLEEGVLNHFHHGRICLIGDSAHKVHPNLALGGNLAIEGVTSLMNNLNNVMKTVKGSKPSGMALNMAFAAYQSEQR